MTAVESQEVAKKIIMPIIAFLTEASSVLVSTSYFQLPTPLLDSFISSFSFFGASYLKPPSTQF